MKLLFGLISNVTMLSILFSLLLAAHQQLRKLTAAQREQFLLILDGGPRGTIYITSALRDTDQ